MTTVCRTVGVVAVWWTWSSFLISGLPNYAVDHGNGNAEVFYVVAILIVTGGAVVATGILWLAGRRRRAKVPPADRAFEVVMPPPPA